SVPRTMRSASCALRLLRRAGKSTCFASAASSRACTALPMARMVMYGPAAVQASSASTSATASHSHFFIVATSLGGAAIVASRAATASRSGSEFQVQRRAQVVDEGGQRVQVLRQRRAQSRPGHHAVVNAAPGDEVLVPQVVDESEIRRKPARRPHQHLVLVEVEAAPE